MIWLLLACTGTPSNDSGDTPTDDTQAGDTQRDDTQSPADAHFCAPEDLIATISVGREGSASVASFSAVVYDKSNPWIGAPTAQSDACGYYLYQASFCEGCVGQQVCSSEGECVDPQRTIKDASVTVTADSTEYSFQADDQGRMWGQLGEQSAFSFDLQWPGGHVVSQSLELREGLMVTVTSQGSYEAPGTLQVSWSGATEGQVQTVIPINHHASAPTFTQCQAQVSDGGFQVPAEMVDPLSVITGLEFQGVRYGEFLAVETDAGCVQIAVASHMYTNVQFQ